MENEILNCRANLFFQTRFLLWSFFLLFLKTFYFLEDLINLKLELELET